MSFPSDRLLPCCQSPPEWGESRVHPVPSEDVCCVSSFTRRDHHSYAPPFFTPSVPFLHRSLLGDSPNSPSDTVSCLKFSPSSAHFIAGSWDKTISCWEYGNQGQVRPKAQTTADAPILCAAYAGSSSRVAFGGCDNKGFVWDIASGQKTQFAAHDAPIKEVAWVPDQNFLLTGSWDKTLRYWDVRANKMAGSVQQPERVYAMDCKAPLLVVGTAGRHVLIYDVRKPTQPVRTLPSPLKYQTRCINIFPDRTGMAIGSIEGRVAIHHVEDPPPAGRKNFAFKCHRLDNNIYSINCVVFNNRGTFATCGADGSIAFWDKDAQHRLKQFSANNNPVTAADFNPNSTVFGYAVGYDWGRGYKYDRRNKTNAIFLHWTEDKEVNPK